MTNQIFTLCYKRVREAVRAKASVPEAEARDYGYQDDLDVVCLHTVARRAEEEFARVCASVGLRANSGKTRMSPGRSVDVSQLPSGIEVDPRAVVLRHGAAMAVQRPCQQCRRRTQLRC